MTERKDEVAIRRILVALDASMDSLAALEAAAELAAGLKAELLGLFVEDVNLFRLAELSFARAIQYTSGTERRLDSPEMERMVRLQAGQAQRALAATAERARVRWSFRIARGQVTTEVLTAAREADLLMLGKASRPVGRRAGMGSTARAAAARAPRPVLLLRHGACLGKPVLVVYDGSVASRHALAVAARLAQTDHDALSVLVMADTAEAVQRLAAEAAGLLEPRGVQARYRRVAGGGAQALARAVKAEGGGVLVLGGSSPLLQERVIQELLDDLECPALLVR